LGQSAGQVHGNRKKFRGVLERVDGVSGPASDEPRWQIVWRDELPLKPGQKPGKNRQLPPLQALGFVLSDLKDARLAPVVSFNGRTRMPAGC